MVRIYARSTTTASTLSPRPVRLSKTFPLPPTLSRRQSPMSRTRSRRMRIRCTRWLMRTNSGRGWKRKRQRWLDGRRSELLGDAEQSSKRSVLINHHQPIPVVSVANFPRQSFLTADCRFSFRILFTTTAIFLRPRVQPFVSQSTLAMAYDESREAISMTIIAGLSEALYHFLR